MGRTLERMDIQFENNGTLTPEVEEVALKLFDHYKSSMVAAAAAARERAVSWRPKPFKIGCSLLAFNEHLDLAEPQLFTAPNYKPKEGEWDWPDRRCGEMSCVYQALSEKSGFIAAFVTVTNERSTGEAGTEEHDVVHPCQKCREMFRDLMVKGVISLKTMIYNVRDDGTGKEVKSQQMNVEELLKKYEEVDLHQ